MQSPFFGGILSQHNGGKGLTGPHASNRQFWSPLWRMRAEPGHKREMDGKQLALCSLAADPARAIFGCANPRVFYQQRNANDDGF